MTSKVRSAAIRSNDRPVRAMREGAEDLTLEPGRVTADYKPRSPYRLDQIFPNIAKYRAVPVKRVFDPTGTVREEERMWSKAWLLAGVSSDIPEPGDGFDIGPQSIIVVRGKDGEVKAFYDVCKHHGNELVQDEFGKGTTSFTCIMHSWRYKLKGKNVRIADRETFKPEALCRNLDLTPVHARDWGGLVFVGMAKEPMPFEKYFADLMPMLASYEIEAKYVVKDLSIEVPANRKTMYPVFNENYRAHAMHPRIKPYVDGYTITGTGITTTCSRWRWSARAGPTRASSPSGSTSPWPRRA